MKICEYERNYSMLNTFEPFRQGPRDFALISRSYTKTAVLDLATGAVIAEEIDETGEGFCPVGFYVPDWWDIHAGTSAFPGHHYWSADKEWPGGDFGFVWGCHWGDDNSWKVQLLDLSRIQEGIISRSERFGSVELDTQGFSCPCLDDGEIPSGKPPPFIRLERDEGETSVSFSVEMDFDLESGAAKDWKRL